MRTSSTDRPRRSFANLGLTERQVDVLALMMQGKSNKAICRVLHLAEPTVKKHVTAILTALQVTNRIEAVIAIGQLGSKLPIVGETVRNRRNRTSDSPAEPDASNSGSAGVGSPSSRCRTSRLSSFCRLPISVATQARNTSRTV